MKHLMAIVCLLFFPASWSLAQDTATAPQGVVNFWAYLIGEWDVSGTVGEIPVAGKADFAWVADKSCYLGKQVWQRGPNGQTIYLALLGGWNAVEHEIVEQGFSSLGESATVRYQIPLQDDPQDMIEGRIVGVSGQERRWEGDVKVERVGPDEFRLTTTVDGRVVHSLRYTRQRESSSDKTR